MVATNSPKQFVVVKQVATMGGMPTIADSEAYLTAALTGVPTELPWIRVVDTVGS
jgi:hypothetical protein